MLSETPEKLACVSVLITRPVGHGRRLARRIRALGGEPVSLPGVSLRPVADRGKAKELLRIALDGDFIVFTSPSSVSFAADLAPLSGTAQAATVGRGTARVLRRHGVENILVPTGGQNSEGLLAHPGMMALEGKRVAVVGASGGRSLLQQTFSRRGALLRQVNVYNRQPARLTRWHRQAIRKLYRDCYILLSSSQSLHSIKNALCNDDWGKVLDAHAIVSSQRLYDAAGQSGFANISLAASALDEDLLQQVVLQQASKN